MGYRADFEKRYGKLRVGYEIHHIDLNHKNNAMSNLMVLPVGLHREYHKALQEIKDFGYVAKFPFTPTGHGASLPQDRIRYFLEILDACDTWLDFKQSLDHSLPCWCSGIKYEDVFEVENGNNKS